MGFLKDRIWTWGYVLDKVPSAAPFTFEKTRCSLETQTAYLGAERTFYMNSMFSREHIEKNFKAKSTRIFVPNLSFPIYNPFSSVLPE